jgi:hypothetical protein
MNARRNISENALCGRFACPPTERLATTFANGKHPARFAATVRPEVLARLIARQSRRMRGNRRELIGRGRFSLPTEVNKFRCSSIGTNCR